MLENRYHIAKAPWANASENCCYIREMYGNPSCLLAEQRIYRIRIVRMVCVCVYSARHTYNKSRKNSLKCLWGYFAFSFVALHSAMYIVYRIVFGICVRCDIHATTMPKRTNGKVWKSSRAIHATVNSLWKYNRILCCLERGNSRFAHCARDPLMKQQQQPDFIWLFSLKHACTLSFSRFHFSSGTRKKWFHHTQYVLVKQQRHHQHQQPQQF